MNEWQMRKLGDVLSLRRETWKVGDEPTKYVGLEHIGVASLRLSAIGHSKDVESNKSKFGPENILFGKLRPYFRKVINPNFHGICSSDIWVFDVNQGASKDFMFYFVADNRFVQLATKSSGGTRMPRADWSYLSELEFYFPPLREQEAIAEVLSSLDYKIDLLKRQNKTLEGMAEALFRQWFIEEAQDDWEEVELGDVYGIERGLSYQGAGLTNSDDPNGVPMFNLNSVLEYGGYKEEGIKFYNGAHKERHVVRPGDILVANTEQGHDHRLIGFPCLVPTKFERGILSHHLYKLTPKAELGGHFIHELLKTTAVRGQVEGCTNGSTVNMLLIDLFERVSFKRPPEEIHDAFEKQASALHQRKEKNWATIENLVQQRDTLLPKLMSGEVRVNLD